MVHQSTKRTRIKKRGVEKCAKTPVLGLDIEKVKRREEKRRKKKRRKKKRREERRSTSQTSSARAFRFSSCGSLASSPSSASSTPFAAELDNPVAPLPDAAVAAMAVPVPVVGESETAPPGVSVGALALAVLVLGCGAAALEAPTATATAAAEEGATAWSRKDCWWSNTLGIWMIFSISAWTKLERKKGSEKGAIWVWV